MQQKVAEGDTVQVYIKNDSPLGGSTQMTSFTVESVHINKIVGIDENWGDECVISGIGTDTVEYSDSGKNGEVDSIEVMETDKNGVTIYGSGEPLNFA
jgi:hypothetical protein